MTRDAPLSLAAVPRDDAPRWMAAAFAVAVALALAVLLRLGMGEGATRLALRVTARWSFALFWCAYCGGPLAALFGARFAALARRGREFGLAFAAAHLMHVALVLRLVAITGRNPVGSMLPFFALGLVATYGLALLSLPRLRRALPPAAWRLTVAVALNYIELVFFWDFVVGPVLYARTFPLSYLPFTLLTALAPGLRLAAFAQRRLSAGRGSSGTTRPCP